MAPVSGMARSNAGPYMHPPSAEERASVLIAVILSSQEWHLHMAIAVSACRKQNGWWDEYHYFVVKSCWLHPHAECPENDHLAG